MKKKRSFSGLTKQTPEHLLLDAGAFFKNFTYEVNGESNDTFDSAVAAGKLIGATKGGGEFSAVPEIRQIEVDGVKGRAKGLEVIDSWDVYLKATVLETTTEAIHAALSAADVDSQSDDKYDVITGNSAIRLDDYVDNNGLNTEGLKFNVQDKSEATIPLTFYGHYTFDDLDSPPFKILYPKKQQQSATRQGGEES